MEKRRVPRQAIALDGREAACGGSGPPAGCPRRQEPAAGACLLALVRHGETPWTEAGRLQGHSDVPLSPAGREQAEDLAIRLAREAWDALYTSPLARARQTAEAIARRVGLCPVTDEGLIERDFGALSGLTWDERRRRFPQDAAVPGLESKIDMLARVRGALARLARRHPGGRVIAVSHGAVINAVLQAAGLAGAPRGGPGAQEVGRVQVATASVSLVRCDGETLVTVGSWAG